MSRRALCDPILGRLRCLARVGGMLASVVLFFAACGDDSALPGDFRLVVSEELALGGALLELSGEGVLGVRGPPGVVLATGSVPGEGSKSLPRLRVLAIQETPGPLTLIVELEDRDAPLIGAVLVQASGVDDTLIPPGLLPQIQVVR